SLVHRAGMAIIGHVATCLGLFPYYGMTVTDMIHRADETMCRVIARDELIPRIRVAVGPRGEFVMTPSPGGSGWQDSTAATSCSTPAGA
ncbi:MAG: hypothetical protein WBM19_08550, partial [Azonexus sp.]